MAAGQANTIPLSSTTQSIPLRHHLFQSGSRRRAQRRHSRIEQMKQRMGELSKDAREHIATARER